MKVIDAKDLCDLLRLVLDPFGSRIIAPNAEQRLARLMGRIAFAVLRELIPLPLLQLLFHPISDQFNLQPTPC